MEVKTRVSSWRPRINPRRPYNQVAESLIDLVMINN